MKEQIIALWCQGKSTLVIASELEADLEQVTDVVCDFELGIMEDDDAR